MHHQLRKIVHQHGSVKVRCSKPQISNLLKISGGPFLTSLIRVKKNTNYPWPFNRAYNPTYNQYCREPNCRYVWYTVHIWWHWISLYTYQAAKALPKLRTYPHPFAANALDAWHPFRRGLLGVKFQNEAARSVASEFLERFRGQKGNSFST